MDDAIYEGLETATLTLSAPSPGIQLGTLTTQNITITDNDTAPTISIGDAMIVESDANAIFTVTQSAVSGLNTTFNYSTTDVTATAGADYTGVTNLSGTITAGSTSTAITIPVIQDAIYEDDETFTVTLNSPINSTIAGGPGTGTISDDETYYVDNTNVSCSDAGTGTSPDVPFCTITKGASVATAGKTVHVLHGTYAETVYPNSGVAGSPITFNADPGVTVTGDPTGFGSAFALSLDSYVVINGFNIANTPYKGIYVDASNHITISNNHVSNSGVTSTTHPYEQGIYLRSTTYSTITGNTTDHNTCIGIRLVLNSDYNLVSNNVSFSNYSVVETDAAGIEMTGTSHNTIINNITYSNEDSGINIYVHDSGVQSSYNLVIGNLSYENGDHGIDNNNSPYNTFIGNTVHGNGTVGINIEGEPASVHTTRLCSTTSALETGLHLRRVRLAAIFA